MSGSIDIIEAELAHLSDRLLSLAPETIGMFTVKTANRTLEEAALSPNPNSLWLRLWYEGEVCCLFSDSNLGKSIYATQIAAHIAEKQKVLYFDFELSDKQFQLRYTDDYDGLHKFPENLYRVEINRESLDVNNFEDAVIDNIEQAALVTGAKILIIDNLTYLCIAAEKGDVAGNLMFRLTGLKKKHGLSILVLAHTPKRPLSNPITQNDLAGSKKLYNFFDSVFSIGKSAKDNQLRYIKQLKIRHGAFTHDSDHVIVAEIKKTGPFLHFEQTGYAEEKDHLKEPSEVDKSTRIMRAKELKAQGSSNVAIAQELGVSEGAVRKWFKP